MSFNLVNLIAEQAKGALMPQMSQILGEEGHKTAAAADSAIPAMLSGLLGTSRTSAGAESLFNTLQNQDDGLLDRLGSMLGGGQATAVIDQGNSMFANLLGSGGLGKLAGTLAGFTGLSKGGTSSLIGMLAPVIFGVLKRKVASEGLNPARLARLFDDQQDNIASAMPQGLASQLSNAGFGFGSTVSGADAQQAGMGAAAATAAGGVAAGAAALAGQAHGAAGNLGAQASDAAAHLGGQVSGAVGNVGGQVGNAAGNIGGQVGNAVGNIGGQASGAAANLGGQVSGAVDSVAAKAGGTIDGAHQAAGSMADSARQAAGNMADDARQAAGNIANDARQAAGSVADGARDAAAQASERVVDAGHAAKEASSGGGFMKPLLWIAALAALAWGAWQFLQNRDVATDVSGAIDGAVEQAGDAANAVGNAASDAVTTVGEAADAATDAASDAAADAGSAMGDATAVLSGPAAEAGEQISGLFSSTTDALGGITDMASAQAALPALQGVGSKIDNVTRLVDSVPEAARGPLNNIVQNGMGTLQPVVDRVMSIDGVGNMLQPIVGPLMESLAKLGG